MVLLLSSFSMSRFTFQLLKQHKNFKIHQIHQSVPMGQATVKNFKIQIRQSVPMGLFATVKNFKIHQIRQVRVPMGLFATVKNLRL